MAEIKIQVPDNMGEYVDELKEFFDGMVAKLAANTHKGRWENVDVKRAVGLLHGEIYELMVSLVEEKPEDTLKECTDVANMAMIIASVRRRDEA